MIVDALVSYLKNYPAIMALPFIGFLFYYNFTTNDEIRNERVKFLFFVAIANFIFTLFAQFFFPFLILVTPYFTELFFQTLHNIITILNISLYIYLFIVLYLFKFRFEAIPGIAFLYNKYTNAN